MPEDSFRGVEPRLFNTPLECGFRLLFVLDAVSPRRCDLQRLVSYDYLLVHSADIEGGPASLHPPVPFRGGEWLIRRDVISAGLDLMLMRELLAKSFDKDGITYSGTSLTNAFLSLLRDDYGQQLRKRAYWLAVHVADWDDGTLAAFMRENIGRWGAEFDRISALRDLEL